jgi:hypothetical protein
MPSEKLGEKAEIDASQSRKRKDNRGHHFRGECLLVRIGGVTGIKKNL